MSRCLIERLRPVMALALIGCCSGTTGWACSVCYGEPDSPVARGLEWAIVVLGLIVGCVLAAVVAFFVQANRKASGTVEMSRAQ